LSLGIAALSDLERWIFNVPRQDRLHALKSVIARHGFQPSFWHLVGAVWTDTESVIHQLDEWDDIWRADIPGRHACMNRHEQRAWHKLPTTFTVYRGVRHKWAVEAMSWTLSRPKAEWFARRWSFIGSPLLATGTVDRQDALALFLCRKEREIVVLPDNVIDVSIERLSKRDLH
jgi:hypothetical protein